jgi:hypothetical protein
MLKWSILITASYALILLLLLVPGFIALSGLPSDSSDSSDNLYTSAIILIPVGILLLGQALLLFLSVDTSRRLLKPRAHIFVSYAVTAFFMAVLTSAAIWSLGFAAKGSKFGNTYTNVILIFCATLWWFWGVFFYLYFRESSAAVTRLVSWLLKGSVLELLIAVPCHVIVRGRKDCSAPIVTSFGITTGLAIMLLSFGPSVLFLYKKRLDSYPPGPSPLP